MDFRDFLEKTANHGQLAKELALSGALGAIPGVIGGAISDDYSVLDGLALGAGAGLAGRGGAQALKKFVNPEAQALAAASKRVGELDNFYLNRHENLVDKLDGLDLGGGLFSRKKPQPGLAESRQFYSDEIVNNFQDRVNATVGAMDKGQRDAARIAKGLEYAPALAALGTGGYISTQ